MSSRDSFLFEYFLILQTWKSQYILFLFYYIFINLFIKIINLINDDCIQLIYVSLIITITCLYPCLWSLMSLITGAWKLLFSVSPGKVKINTGKWHADRYFSPGKCYMFVAARCRYQIYEFQMVLQFFLVWTLYVKV